jgi:hypothetical protein
MLGTNSLNESKRQYSGYLYYRAAHTLDTLILLISLAMIQSQLHIGYIAAWNRIVNEMNISQTKWFQLIGAANYRKQVRTSPCISTSNWEKIVPSLAYFLKHTIKIVLYFFWDLIRYRESSGILSSDPISLSLHQLNPALQYNLLAKFSKVS